MASSTTSGVYIQVIEDVVRKVRDEFINNGGPGESVLNELQGIWELKMMQAGAILGPIERSSASRPTPGGPITPVHDLNVPYEGTEEYETPTADLLFPPTPIQTPLPGTAQTPLPGTVQTPLLGTAQTPTVDLLFPPTPLQTPIQTPLPGTAQTPLPGTTHTPLPGTADNSMYNIPTGGTPITPGDNSADNGGVSEMKPGRPSQFMQPPSPWLNQRPPLDVNVAYEEGREEVDRGASSQSLTQDFFTISSGKRKRDDFGLQYRNGGYIPQQDGAGDSISDEFKTGQGAIHDVVTATNREFAQGMKFSSQIPQVDGPLPDLYDDALSTPNIYNYQGVVNEDYNNVASTPAPNELQAATPAIVTQNDVDDEDDEPLNENDDDDDLDDVDQEEDLNTQHLVLAQFDKVTRTKSRWKCTLKDGIMHINNKDILFNKATGEFDF